MRKLVCQVFCCKHSLWKHCSILSRTISLYRSSISFLSKESTQGTWGPLRWQYLSFSTLLLIESFRKKSWLYQSKDATIFKASLSYERMLLFLVTVCLKFFAELSNKNNSIFLHITCITESLYSDILYWTPN